MDLLTDQLNIYNSVVANRMNDIMKILTIFAAIFIPLTFIAGIYGTNFEYLPELHYKYSYFIFWAVLIVMAAALLFFFQKEKMVLMMSNFSRTHEITRVRIFVLT